MPITPLKLPMTRPQDPAERSRLSAVVARCRGLLPAGALALVAAACVSSELPAELPSASPMGGAVEASAAGIRSASVERTYVHPPLVLRGSAYEAAANVVLPQVPPGNYPGLVNVYRLSDRIISGSEPVDEEALSQLVAWGVRTVLSVDGKAPNLEAADRLGLRYVHVPLRYRGVEPDELAKIAKTFRELQGPFYVHCFHGKHRGPAAAAIGRVALDGLDRERAIAEMRQWSSTAAKYEGLYASVATSTIPSATETAAFEFGFDRAHTFGGVREAMVTLTRSWDEVKLVRKNEWAASADHPDIDPLRSATVVKEHLDACAAMDDAALFADDFHGWLDTSRKGTTRLVELLGLKDGGGGTMTPEALEGELEAAYRSVARTCVDCHGVYRN